MRTIRTKVYKFSELSKDAKKKAIELLWNINVDYDWYEMTYEDAANIGVKIDSFDIDRHSISGSFITSAGEVVESILIQHGEHCTTYKTAKEYKHSFQSTSDEVDETELEETEDKFLNSILQNYLKILGDAYEYLTSEEEIEGTIEANEYEFYANGKMI